MMRKNPYYLLIIFSVLFVFSIACKQAGEIITPAEATQRYEATQAAKSGDVVVEAEGAVYSPGDTVQLVSEGHLVGLFQEPGGPSPFSFATRGDEVTITSSVNIDGVLWYQIDSIAGSGWLPETNFAIEE
jgi:hypothetical protein